ncbi:hypothetical protein [Bergeyella sp. RCAD1439]|uniref:hypothetical protein n=1 Tax=Bergeyella anatis TaxID=3113737 RepID=UPI002E18433B|nr:hypothetical protein [Bergeyella sp. RCAD1439]
MKNIILFFLILISFNSCAQKNKLENFQIVSYDLNSPNSVEINSYSTLDKEGKLKVFVNGSKGPAYYSYQLKPEDLKQINKLANKNLEEFVQKKQLAENQGYAGSRNYISFFKKTKKQLCYIEPFMNKEFNEISNLLFDKIYSQQDSAKISKFFVDFNNVEKEILKQDKIDNYLPQKSLPSSPLMPNK